MVDRPEVLAIVQARGGSKGLPRKNLRLLGGHPLVAYSIASALAARSITRVIMSTDDEEIAEVARSYGAEVPFPRPAQLAADDTPDYPLFEHALAELAAREGYRPQFIVQLRPTTPLRPRGMLDEAVRILAADAEADCVRGVTVPKQTPYKMWREGPDGTLVPLLECDLVESYNMPRQQLPVAFWQTGHVDVIRSATITTKHSLTGDRVRPILIDPNYCVDIDTLVDFDLAERAISEKHLEIDLPAPFAHGALHATGDGERTVRRPWPATISLVVFDFDGVFTDNRVYTLEDGREAVVCSRGDGLGLTMLRGAGLPIWVLSTEENPVVAARCRKLKLSCRHGLADKRAALTALAGELGVRLEQVVYVGNDANDLGAMQAAGFAIAPADAHTSALDVADLVVTHVGGAGAVREVCDLILARMKR